MARKKVTLQLIKNESARRATFKKRQRGLMKKVRELSTLCGVEACAIVYGPYDPKPEVWSSKPDAWHVLKRFKSMPEIEQSKKMMNQEGFIRQSINKLREQLKKQQRENRVTEITQLMHQSLRGKGLQGVPSDDLTDLAWLVEEKMKGIHERVEGLRRTAMSAPQLIPSGNERVQMQMQMQMPAQIGVGGGGNVVNTAGPSDIAEAMKRHPWFMDVMNSHGGYYGGDEFGRLMETMGHGPAFSSQDQFNNGFTY